MNNKPYTLTKNNNTAGIYRSIEQLWRNNGQLKKLTNYFSELLDIDYKLSDLLFFINFNKYKSVTKRLTSTDSPYTVLNTDKVLFCDTDSGSITVSLPAGIKGTELQIMNVGDSGNNVIVSPNGTEQIFKNGAGVSFTMVDFEGITIHYDETEGWR